MQVGLEFLLERFASAVDERLGGREGAAQDAGDVLIGKLVLAAEGDGQALFFGQGGEGFLDFLLQFPVQKGLGGEKVLPSGYWRGGCSGSSEGLESSEWAGWRPRRRISLRHKRRAMVKIQVENLAVAW